MAWSGFDLLQTRFDLSGVSQNLAENFDPEYLEQLAHYYTAPCKQGQTRKVKRERARQISLFDYGIDGGWSYREPERR